MEVFLKLVFWAEEAFRAIVGDVEQPKPSMDKVGLLWAGMGYAVSDLIGYYAMIIASVFGAIHFATWNSAAKEQWLWQACTVCTTGIPLLVIALFEAGRLSRISIIQKIIWHLPKPIRALDLIGIMCILILPFIYVLCRLTLLCLSFVQLSSLSSEVFIDIPWPQFISCL
jgi:hypothetical protein